MRKTEDFLFETPRLACLVSIHFKINSLRRFDIAKNMKVTRKIAFKNRARNREKMSTLLNLNLRKNCFRSLVSQG